MYMGTAKTIMLKVWFEHGIDTFSQTEIKKRMASLIVPPNVKFSRLPASIQTCSGFTAEQWMVWTNYYSQVCLYNVLPLDDFRCWHQEYYHNTRRHLPERQPAIAILSMV